ncbi:MAG: hypothetical protein DRJ39_01445 [Thermoprotei archaeon]|nr:MAG: hypothetical protein DRJ39_01445 [Thermoprotei archaeon]
MSKKFITLLTDFGYEDHYIAVLKGIIYSICPEAFVVDITHSIPKFNTKVASCILNFAYKYFPRGTIHSVTVYPEVGTNMKALIMKTKNYVFVGPDNGVLSIAAEDDGIEKVYEITNKDYMRDDMSRTFHGRDIFAPVPAFLACGVKPEDMGVQVYDYHTISMEKSYVKNESITGEIIHVDSYGNVIMNIGKEQLDSLNVLDGEILEVHVGVIKYEIVFAETFSGISPGKLGLIIDSENLLELCVFKGSAAKMVSASIGDKIQLKKKS